MHAYVKEYQPEMPRRAIRSAYTPRSAQPGGAILRLRTGGDGWAENVPPAPPSHSVTVTFTTLDARALHGDAMELLGYRVAGTLTCSSPRIWWRLGNAGGVRCPNVRIEGSTSWRGRWPRCSPMCLTPTWRFTARPVGRPVESSSWSSAPSSSGPLGTR